MKRLLFVALALIFVLVLVVMEDHLIKIVILNQVVVNDSKTLKVGTEGTYAPFTFHNKQDKLTGYDIDVIKAVAKEKGYKLKFNETSWDSMFVGLDAKRFDVIANQVGVNKDREKNINSLHLTLIQAQF